MSPERKARGKCQKGGYDQQPPMLLKGQNKSQDVPTCVSDCLVPSVLGEISFREKPAGNCAWPCPLGLPSPLPLLYFPSLCSSVCYYKRCVVSDGICLPDSNAELHEGQEAFPCVHVGVGNHNVGLAITMMGVEGRGVRGCWHLGGWGQGLQTTPEGRQILHPAQHE